MAIRIPVMIMLLLLVGFSIGLPHSSLSESKDSEKATEVTSSEGEKFMFPALFQFTAAIRPPPPSLPPPRPPPQTLVIPPGTEVSVNSQQPFVVHQQGTTVINTGK